MNKTNGSIKTKEENKRRKQKMQRMTKAKTIGTVHTHTHTHTHTSNLGKIINIYKRRKGNIMLSSSYYDTG